MLAGQGHMHQDLVEPDDRRTAYMAHLPSEAAIRRTNVVTACLRLGRMCSAHRRRDALVERSIERRDVYSRQGGETNPGGGGPPRWYG